MLFKEQRKKSDNAYLVMKQSGQSTARVSYKNSHLMRDLCDDNWL